MKKKAYTLLELTITIVLIAFLITANIYFIKETRKNNKWGAQLSIMRLYEAEQLYKKENGKYTDNLEEIWEYQKRILSYPVTIVDYRKRSINKEKEPIIRFRIDRYYINVKTFKNNTEFLIEAEVPIADKNYKEYPKFTVNQNKEVTPPYPDNWLIKIK